MNIAKISRQLFEDVKNSGRVFYPKPNEMYAHRFGRNRIWYRTMVKFWRHNKCVLHLVDKSGVHDLNDSIEIRRIQSQHLCDKFGEIKLFICGITAIENDNHELNLIFTQTIQNKPSIAIFTKIENKRFRLNEAYAGDILFQENGQQKSFRDLLVGVKQSRNRWQYASVNKIIFATIIEFLKSNKMNSISVNDEKQMPSAIVLENQFHLQNQIAAGGVCIEINQIIKYPS